MKWRDDGGRGDLTERQWQKLQPLLPPQKAHTGQPCYDHRRILNGILWLHRTGAPWRDIPERYGKHSTITSAILPMANYRTMATPVGKSHATS
jgi:transposase